MATTIRALVVGAKNKPSQNTASSGDQSPRSSHAECTCQVQIQTKISFNDYNLAVQAQSDLLKSNLVCIQDDTNHQSELVKRNVFLPLRRILARVSVRRGSRRTYLSGSLLSRGKIAAFLHLFGFSMTAFLSLREVRWISSMAMRRSLKSWAKVVSAPEEASFQPDKVGSKPSWWEEKFQEERLQKN